MEKNAKENAEKTMVNNVIKYKDRLKQETKRLCLLFAMMLLLTGTLTGCKGTKSDTTEYVGVDEFSSQSETDYSRYEGKDEIPILQAASDGKKENASYDRQDDTESEQNPTLEEQKENLSEKANSQDVTKASTDAGEESKDQTENTRKETDQQAIDSDTSGDGQTTDTSTQNAKEEEQSKKENVSKTDGKEKQEKEDSGSDSEPEKNTTTALTCTLTVDCATILSHMDQLAEGKEGLVPGNGILYGKREVTFTEGETVFDVLLREMKNNRIHMDYSYTPAYSSNYIKGIGNLYEFDCGDLSGWMYCVNGVYPNYGCSQYVLSNGDSIQFRYTCDLGRDL